MRTDFVIHLHLNRSLRFVRKHFGSHSYVVTPSNPIDAPLWVYRVLIEIDGPSLLKAPQPSR